MSTRKTTMLIYNREIIHIWWLVHMTIFGRHMVPCGRNRRSLNKIVCATSLLWDQATDARSATIATTFHNIRNVSTVRNIPNATTVRDIRDVACIVPRTSNWNTPLATRHYLD